jgi:2-polyprenyl-6-methoxyphenol hydroxylase-like FAD-dependent oxidoreductase
VSQVRLDTWSRARVALVGDAAFCVSLTGGQCSALAMAAAYILAGELARVAGEPQLAFLQYERRLRRFITSKQRAAERFAAVFAPKTQSGLALRNVVINLAAWPGPARRVIGRGIVDSIALPDYPALQPPASA